MKDRKHQQPLTRQIIRAIFILLALLPFALGGLAAIHFFTSYGRHKLISIATYALFFIMLLLLLRTATSKMSEPALLLAIFSITIFIRAFSQVFLNTQPISDYMDAVNAAIQFMPGPVRELETARFPYWGFYRVTLTHLFRLFGSSIANIKIMNLLLSGCTAISMFLLGKIMTGSRKFGFLAATIYMADLADILYINLPTGEHIFTMLFPIVCIVFLAIFNHPDRKTAGQVGFAILLGILIGLMDMYKPVGIILLIAMLITLALIEWLPKKRNNESAKRRKQLLTHGLLVVLILTAYFTTKEVGFSVVSYYAQVKANRHGIGWTLRVGLNMKTNGRVSSSLAYEMGRLYAETNENYQLASSYLMEDALNQIRGQNIGTIFNFVREKFSFTWKSNQDFYNWASNTQMESGLMAYDADRLALLVDPLNDAFLLFSLAFAFIGAVYCAIQCTDKGSLTIGLFILGFALLLLAVEVQQRYRSILASSIPFFCTYGLYALSDVVSTIGKRITKTVE